MTEDRAQQFPDHLNVRRFSWLLRSGDTRPYRTVNVRAGWRGRRRIVPPAGEAHAFDVDDYAREVEVTVSPTGRSVRVYVDGVEVPKR